jgi:hypothetical protein
MRATLIALNLIGLTSAGRAMPPTPFDAAPFRDYPLSEVIDDFARGYAVTLTSQDRSAFLSAIAHADPARDVAPGHGPRWAAYVFLPRRRRRRA